MVFVLDLVVVCWFWFVVFWGFGFFFIFFD